MYRLTETGESFLRDIELLGEEYFLKYGSVGLPRLNLGVLWTVKDTGEIPPGSENMDKAWELMNRGYIEEI